MTERDLIRKILFEREFGSGFMTGEIDIDKLIWEFGITGAVDKVSLKLERLNDIQEFDKGLKMAYRRFIQRHRGGYCGRDNLGSNPGFNLP